MAPKNLAGSSHFKAFRHRLLCFASRNRLWHKEPGKYALDRTWQEEIWVMLTIAAKEPNSSHKERKDRRKNAEATGWFRYLDESSPRHYIQHNYFMLLLFEWLLK
jgi:hypothetical protein